MPTGNLVVKNPIQYNIEGWDYKTYDNDHDIRMTLKNKWCSTVINLFIFDESTQYNTVKDFFESNLYEIHGRHSFLIYCIAVPISISDDVTKLLNKKQKFISDNYTNIFTIDNYAIYVNDFVKNLILL